MKKTETTYEIIKKEFQNIERINFKFGTNFHLNAEITFSQESFTKIYPEESRTYIISSDNKAFKPNMGGYSIYGRSIDGTDPNVRLEKYMFNEQGGEDGWKIEKAFIISE